QQLSQYLFLRPIWVVPGGGRQVCGSLRTGRKFLPPSGRLHRRPVRGTPCALRALADHRSLYWSGVPVAPVPGGLFYSVSGHGLPGYGKRGDLSGRAPAIPAGNRDHLRACRRSRRPRRLSLTLGPGSLQRPQRHLRNGLRPVRRGVCVDHAGCHDVLASRTRDGGYEPQPPPMAAENTPPFVTAFTISIDARRGTPTGNSAKDRATTIQTAIDAKTKPSDLARPGHIFPLRADKGGVLKRAG